MARGRAVRTGMTGAAAALALLAGCSTGSTAVPAQTPSATPYQRLSGIPLNRAVAYSTVRGELTDFLEVWRTKGSAEAAKEYLRQDMTLTSPADTLVLVSGRVVNLTGDDWTSADLFVVSVDFDLTFSGNVGAWGNGRSSRFVTATARSGAIPYVLELATSR